MRLLTNKSLNKQILKCAFSSVPFPKIYRHFLFSPTTNQTSLTFLATKPNFTLFLFTDLAALLAILLVVVQQCGFDPRQGCLYRPLGLIRFCHPPPPPPPGPPPLHLYVHKIEVKIVQRLVDLVGTIWHHH